MSEIVAVDIGGTNARFAPATIDGGQVVALGDPVMLKTADHASFRRAWEAFARTLGRPPPRAAAISAAGPVGGAVLKFTNNPWILRPAALPAELGIDRLTIVNDFGAVGHAVARARPEDFAHVCGPDLPLGAQPVIGIVGPGTGLGVGLVVRAPAGPRIVETEGGHIDFAPLDPIEDGILAFLRPRYRRVSIERIVAGPGLANIHEALAAIERVAVARRGDAALWRAALDGSDGRAAAALDRFCLALGSAAGDIALAQGATAMVLAGGVGLRLRDRLPASGFAARFVAKGRMTARMAAMPVKLVTHPEPGLLGAAIAFAREHGA